MDRSLMKRKLRWNSQFQAQSSSQERSNMAFEEPRGHEEPRGQVLQCNMLMQDLTPLFHKCRPCNVNDAMLK
jgi:hypothetical protein